MAWISRLLEISRSLIATTTIGEVVLFLGPIFFALVIGVVIGWTWKPKWAQLDSSSSLLLSPQSCLSLAANIITTSFNPFFSFISACFSDNNGEEDETFSASLTVDSDSSSSQPAAKSLAVTDEDLENLCQLLEVRDEGPAWIDMMDRSTPTMTYQAWRRDPRIGPPQYRSRTVFEDATPELVRDFFWDDEFRSKWDDMLLYSETLEECPITGTMVVHWIRKFPFFCSDREYIIGRRIWESGRSYYSVTKGVPCPSMTRRNKPRRVDLYYSSWCIRAVESLRGDGQLSACEVLFFHHEDMGIPWGIAKIGIQQGMWGGVKKIEPGLRLYQKARATRAPMSRFAFMAQLNTKISADYLLSLETNTDNSEVEMMDSPLEKQAGINIPKLLVFGGAVVLACSLDRGLLSKVVVFGVAKSLAKIGTKL